MRTPAAEKLEIIRLVEQSHLPARQTLEKLGIRPSTFYRWVDRLRAGGALPLIAIPGVKLDSGRYRPASGHSVLQIDHIVGFR